KRQLAAVAGPQRQWHERFDRFADALELGKEREHRLENRAAFVERQHADHLGRPRIRDVAVEERRQFAAAAGVGGQGAGRKGARSRGPGARREGTSGWQGLWRQRLRWKGLWRQRLWR